MNRYALIDSLESRYLLNAVLNSGVLTINGSNSADIITLQLSGGNIGVTISPENFSQSFTASSITQIDILCGDGNDTLTTNAAITNDVNVDGEGGRDTLTTGAGDDNLAGGTEDDLLDGGAGSDIFQGDTGIDTLSYVSRTDPVNVTLDGTQNDGESGENDQVLTTIDIVYGGSGNDVIDGSAAPANFRGWYGNGGDDTLIGTGTGDRLNGGAGNDSLDGGNGDDTLIGGDGNDVFVGGAGRDIATYYNYSKRVKVFLGTNHNGNGAIGTSERDNFSADDIEILIGGTRNDTLIGTAGNDALYGGDGDDILQGGDGDDYLAGNAGADFLQGDNGNDTMRGSASRDSMSGGAGTDLATYSDRTTGVAIAFNNGSISKDFLSNDVENLDGSQGDDTLTGGTGSGINVIQGLDGDDTINSQDGVIDTVDGGNGTDDITSDSNDIVS